MTEAEMTECGFCLKKGGALSEPRVLPCCHVHCMECLVGNRGVIGMVKCPDCGEVFDVELDSLPAHPSGAAGGGDNSPVCDTCSGKAAGNPLPAVIYCTSCDKKYCAKHQEFHDEILQHHDVISMEAYRMEARKLQKVHCTDHTDQPYILGCRSCHSVFCVNCLTGSDNCPNGAPHELIALDKLVKELTVDIGEVIDREEKLSALFELTSRIISDYENSTVEMVDQLHKRRDEQIEAIRVKYESLEVELVERRGQSKTDMTRFVEEEVWAKLSNLNERRLKIEARMRHSHQVDIVKGCKDTRTEISKLATEEMPTLELHNMVVLQVIAESRGTEVELTTPSDALIDWEHGLTTSTCISIPTSLTLIKTVDVSPHCTSVCCYKGITYVGTDSSQAIDRINENGQLTQSFITFDNYVVGVTAYKDRLYSLVHGNPCTVNVHNLTGQLLTKWSHTSDKSSCYLNLAIVGEQLVIPDTSNRRLTLYSLTGQTLRQIPCPQISTGWVSMCALDDDSVIVSDYTSTQVFRLSITTGEILWTFTCITNPEGVTGYGKNYVCVAAYNQEFIWILNSRTGEVLAKVTANDIKGHVFNLHISGDTLIVPAHSKNRVLLYQLS